MITPFEFIIGAIISFIIWTYLQNKFKRWFGERSRTIPEDIKEAVRKKCYNQCVVCIEDKVLDFHHRKEFSDGGEHTIENLVLLCPTHHAMITRKS